jgi:hypothetical protein
MLNMNFNFLMIKKGGGGCFSADIGVSGPGEKHNKWAPFLGGGQGGFAQRAQLFKFPSSKFYFSNHFYTFPNS